MAEAVEEEEVVEEEVVEEGGPSVKCSWPVGRREEEVGCRVNELGWGWGLQGLVQRSVGGGGIAGAGAEVEAGAEQTLSAGRV